jgi:hypothetical protein
MTRRLYSLQLYGYDTGLASVVTKEYATGSYTAPDADPIFVGRFLDGRVKQPGLIEQAMYAGGGTRGELAIASGSVELRNEDGELDDLIDLSFDGRVFYAWDVTATTRIIHSAIFFGAIEQANFSRRSVGFQVRDLCHNFDAPLMSAQYAGTNVLPAGVEGTANDIKGKYKPLLVGIVKNVSPICVNTSRLIYQLDGQRGFLTGWALTVYDKRSTLTQGANYSSQADMEASAPSAGQYRVWPAGGMFRLGSTPVGQVTCDCTNPASTSVGVTGCEVHTLVYVLGGIAGISGVAGLSNALSANPDCGIYITGEMTRLEAMTRVLEGVNGTIRFSQEAPATALLTNGFVVSNLTDPASMPYTPNADVLELDRSNIYSIDRETQADPERGIPVKRVTVNYLKNGTVMSAADLAGVALADQQFCANEYRSVSAEASISTQWPLAPEIVINSLLVTEAAAQAVADRLIALHSVRRDVFKVSIPGRLGRDMATSNAQLARLAPQARVRITFPRFGLDAGKLFLVLSLVENLEEDTIDMVVWG